MPIFSVRTRLPTIGLVLALTWLAFPAAGQEVTTRTPNLSDGWIGAPGSLQVNFNHRFWLADAQVEDRIINHPTFLISLPVHPTVVTGFQYASSSDVSQVRRNEWEGFIRWAPPVPDLPLELAVTGAWNVHLGSADGEVAVAVPAGPVRVLGAARAFSNALDSDNAGWFVGGGVVVPIHPAVSLAGDMGSLRERGGDRARRSWGAGIQLRIPTTPHTLSLQATNTRTGTLQGSSVGRRTYWGFEFTIPVTFARYFRGGGRQAPEGPSPAPNEAADEVEVTMTDDLRFAPEDLRIQVGQTVVWKNTTQVIHTVTADPDAVRDPEQVELPDGAEPFDSGIMFPDDVFRHTFTVPGEYLYVCVPHDMAPMVGRIVVEPE